MEFQIQIKSFERESKITKLYFSLCNYLLTQYNSRFKKLHIRLDLMKSCLNHILSDDCVLNSNNISTRLKNRKIVFSSAKFFIQTDKNNFRKQATGKIKGRYTCKIVISLVCNSFYLTLLSERSQVGNICFLSPLVLSK